MTAAHSSSGCRPGQSTLLCDFGVPCGPMRPHLHLNVAAVRSDRRSPHAPTTDLGRAIGVPPAQSAELRPLPLETLRVNSRDTDIPRQPIVARGWDVSGGLLRTARGQGNRIRFLTCCRRHLDEQSERDRV
jgi:hypothetical protein